MTSFYRYTTITGDRWDSIANRYRITAYDYVDIIQANPTYQNVFVLPEGVVISVPVKEEQVQRVKPPWES